MQATDFGDGDDPAEPRPLDWPSVGGILCEREVSSCTVVVSEVGGQNASQVLLAKYYDLIEALTPDRADEPLRERVLPGAARRGENLADAHSLEAVPERAAVDRVAVTEQVGRGRVVWEGVDDLLGCPHRRGMLGHVEVDDAPAVVGEDDKDEEHSQARGGHGEEVERDEVAGMVG